jgi:hypothetical protein
MSGFSHPLCLIPHSDVHRNAEKRRWSAHSKFMLLGQQHRWQLHRALGEQVHVRHRLSLRPRFVKKCISAFEKLSTYLFCSPLKVYAKISHTAKPILFIFLASVCYTHLI